MIPLFKLDEIGDPGSKAIRHNQQSLFAVRWRDQVYLYRNRCPHRGIELQWQPDQFLDDSQSLIQCATHGALFIIESGECVSGPCAGDKLEAVACSVVEGTVYLEEE